MKTGALTDPRAENVLTPAYIFDPLRVVQNYRDLKARLNSRLIVSVKANPDLELMVRCAHAFEDGVELSSLGELGLAAGRQRGERFVNSPGLNNELLRAAISSRATLVIDDINQAKIAAQSFHSGHTILPLLLRINVGALLGAGSERDADHFGMSPANVVETAHFLHKEGVPIRGLHVFAGSRRFISDGVQIACAIPHLIAKVEDRLSTSLSLINLGGGFPEDWRSLDFGPYLDAVAPLRERHDIAHEAGRAIFADAGHFATKVIAVKELGDRIVAVCDGGMAQNFLLAQTETFMKKPQLPRVVPSKGHEDELTDKPVLIVGNTCNRADRIGALSQGVRRPQPGDLYIFENCGAYNTTYTVSRFLSLKPPLSYIGPLSA